MSFFGKLFGRPSTATSQRVSDIQTFRNHALIAARQSRLDLTFEADPDDPARLMISGTNGAEAYADVSNSFHHFQAYEEETLQENLSRFVATLRTLEASLITSEPWVFSKEAIALVLRSDDYVQHCLGKGLDLITAPVAGDMHSMLMIDTPDAMQGLTRDKAKEFNDAQLFELGLNNTRKALEDVSVGEPLQGLSLYTVESNSFLITGMIFLDEFWDKVEEKHGQDYYVLLPRKDQLFIVDSKSAAAREIALKIIQVTFEENFNLLSPYIYERKNEKLHILVDA
jgi:hypothetical protein